jgi:hypothetical protein
MKTEHQANQALARTVWLKASNQLLHTPADNARVMAEARARVEREEILRRLGV